MLWALLAKGGEGFQKDIEPKVTKADREALEREGLITSETRGRVSAAVLDLAFSPRSNRERNWAYAEADTNSLP